MYLASYGFFQGGGIGDLLNYWESLGFFTYILPFLLVFALVYAIISNMKLFGQNKGVSAVIALCVGLLSLQFDVVPMFFSEIFPRVGVALSVLLTILILLGLFMPTRGVPQKVFHYLLLIAAIIVLMIVLFQQANSTFLYNIFYFFDAQTFAWLIMGLIVITFIIIIVKPKPKKIKFPPLYPAFLNPEESEE
jgi:hypothetical protein